MYLSLHDIQKKKKKKKKKNEIFCEIIGNSWGPRSDPLPRDSPASTSHSGGCAGERWTADGNISQRRCGASSSWVGTGQVCVCVLERERERESLSIYLSIYLSFLRILTHSHTHTHTHTLTWIQFKTARLCLHDQSGESNHWVPLGPFLASCADARIAH